jgi:hypothetical protein
MYGCVMIPAFTICMGGSFAFYLENAVYSHDLHAIFCIDIMLRHITKLPTNRIYIPFLHFSFALHGIYKPDHQRQYFHDTDATRVTAPKSFS